MTTVALDNTEEIWAIAHALADASGKAILPFFRSRTLSTDNKAADGFDPVTEGDRAAEQAIRAILEARRPDDGILGEEFGHKPSRNGWTWVIDPIDGTRGFLSGTPTWGTLIALADESGPKLGLIDQPYTKERFCGGFGQAQWTGPLGQAPLAVRDTRSLKDAILFTTFPEIGTPTERARFEEVSREVRLVRYGMDCYAYALLAAGQIDLVIEAGLHAYDIQAPIAVIEAAGGIVTDWDGGPAHAGGTALAAATPELHALALERLGRAG